jgi:hypothetical protein
MKISKIMFSLVLAAGIGYFCCLSFSQAPAPAAAADVEVPVPKVIQDGFSTWAKKQMPSYAFDVWKKGGLLEDDRKPDTLATYFNRIDRTVGSYKSYEVIQLKRVSDNSAVFYIAMRFEHAAVYARFLVYRTDKEWVVQNMDFSVRPELVMPWLAFTGETYTE